MKDLDLKLQGGQGLFCVEFTEGTPASSLGLMMCI